MISSARVLLCVAFLTGCAAGPATKTEHQTQLQPHQAEHPKLLARAALATDKGRLVVERDLTFSGGACAFDFHLNGRRFASFLPGNVGAFDLPPGTYTFHMQSGGIICPPYASPGQQVQLSAGQTIRIRMGIEYMLGFVRLEPIAP